VSDTGLRRTVAAVCVLNLAYFGVEFGVALTLGAASLFADSIDFLEDAAVNFLVFVALAWSATRRATVGRLLALLLLVPSLAVPWALWRKFHEPVAPEPFALGLSSRLRSIQAVFSCSWMRCVSRSAVASSAAFSAMGKTDARCAPPPPGQRRVP
jgi:Co/Zn/Cd efflux system component